MERTHLNVPAPATTVQPTSALEHEPGLDGMDNSMAAALLAQALPTGDATRRYTVQDGDTLWDIADRQLGDPTRWSSIAEENQLAQPDAISPGRELRLPGQPQAAPQKPAAQPAKSGLESAWSGAPAGSYGATKAGAHQRAESLRAAVERGELSQAEAQTELSALGQMWSAADQAQRAIAAFDSGGSAQAMESAHRAAELTRALVNAGHLTPEQAAPVLGAMGGFYAKAKAKLEVRAPAGQTSGPNAGGGLQGALSTPKLDQNTAGGSYPGGYCAITALRMILRREGIKDPGADNIALTSVPGYGQPYAPGQGSSGAVLAQRAKQLGLKGAAFTTTDNLDNISASLEAGRPVMVGGIGAFSGKFEGAHDSARYGHFDAGDRHARRYDGSGHWILAVGVKKDSAGKVTDVIVNDPDTGGRMTMSRADFTNFVGQNGDMWTVRYQAGPKSDKEAADRAANKDRPQTPAPTKPQDPKAPQAPSQNPDLSKEGRSTLDTARQGLTGAWGQVSGGSFATAREGAHATAERVREAVKQGQLSSSSAESTLRQAGDLYNAARLAELAQKDISEGRFTEAMANAHQAATLARSLSASGLLKPDEIAGLVSAMGSAYEKAKASAPKEQAPAQQKPQGDQDLGVKDRIQTGRLEGLSRNMADIYNTKGKYLQAKAAELGIDVASAAAVLQVESGGEAFSAPGKPIIRFENHIFYDEWGRRAPKTFDKHFTFNNDRTWTGHRFKGDGPGGWESFHSDQKAENRVLQYAAGLNEAGAYNSISMGLAQIMGFNHKMIGYDSAREMYDDFAKGERQQLDGLFKFIQANPEALAALKRKDYETFAYYYNGSGQAKTYGGLIGEAAGAFKGVTKGKTYQ